MLDRSINKVVVIGECMLELSARDSNSYQKQFAGDTFNTALYLKRSASHLNVSYLTAVGEDLLSKEFVLMLDREGIDASLIQYSSERHLGSYIVRTDQQGERSFLYWRESSAARNLFYLYKGDLEGCDLIYFSGISLAILDHTQRERLIVLADKHKRKGGIIAFDINYRSHLWSSKASARFWMDKAYAIADIAFAGGDDHLVLFGHTCPDDIFDYLSSYQISEIVNKNGADSIHLQWGQEKYTMQPEDGIRVVDTTGAGDSYNGAYLAARIKGESPLKAAKCGAELAARVIGVRGAIVPKVSYSASQYSDELGELRVADSNQ